MWSERRLLLLLMLSLGGCRAVPWKSTLNRDHPWVGRIWDARSRRWVDERVLVAELVQTDFVLLGETHDNPDHHALQARIVRELIRAGRRPALAFEMLSADQQPLIEAKERTARELAQAVRWRESGWPDFAIYEPVFEAGLGAKLRLVAANLPASLRKALVFRGEDALPPELREAMAREPLTPEARAALREQMVESHCGEMPESMLEPMMRAQRARDAQLALRTLAGRTEDGAVLIAGREHARRDRGVPAYLANEAPETKSVSVAFVEVSADAQLPEAPVFDYLIFTPGSEREDPCASLRKYAR